MIKNVLARRDFISGVRERLVPVISQSGTRFYNNTIQNVTKKPEYLTYIRCCGDKIQ